MANWLAAVWLLLIFTGFAVSERCDQNELMRCSTPLPGLSSSADLSLSREQLDKSCLDLQAGLRCINNYTEHCMTPPERQRFKSMYSGVNSMMHSLCQPGSYQDDYLRHAACIKRVKPEYEGCSRVYEVALAGVTGDHARDSETREQYLKTVCCSFQEYLSCSEQTVQRSCGDETSAFTSDFLKRISSDIIRSYCLEYRGNECAMMSGAHRHSNWLTLTLLTSLGLLLAGLASGHESTERRIPV